MVAARFGSVFKVFQERSDQERGSQVSIQLCLVTTSTLIIKCRTNFGSVLLHLAVESARKDTRQATNKLVAEAAVWDPQLTTTLIRETVAAFLSRTASITKVAPGGEAPVWNKHARLASILLSSVAYEENVDIEVKEKLVTELAIVAHHELVCEYELWTSLYLRADDLV